MRLKLSFWNVRYGLNCRIIGPLRLRMTHDAKIIVGHHLTAIAGYNSTIVSSKKNVWSVVGGGKSRNSRLCWYDFNQHLL